MIGMFYHIVLIMFWLLKSPSNIRSHSLCSILLYGIYMGWGLLMVLFCIVFCNFLSINKHVVLDSSQCLNVGYWENIGCHNQMSDFRDISETSSKFQTSWRITNICLIHTQLIQNYINMFRIGILILTFCIHSLNCFNFQHQPTYQIFLKMSADISDFSRNVGGHFPKRHFK